MTLLRVRARALFNATVAALIVLAAAGPASAATAPSSFRNPIAPLLPGTTSGFVALDSPDPWILTFHGRYYLTNSAGSKIVLRSAVDIGGLASAPLRVLWPRPQTPPPASRCCNFWAPEIHRLHGPLGWRWYVYSAVDDGNLLHHHLQVLESASDDPVGPYRFAGMLALGPDYQIDPTVFLLRGREYVIYSDAPANIFFPSHLALAPLLNPWTVNGPPVTISTPTYPWERTVFAINEGPEVLRHGPWLHVIYSGGYCGVSTYSLGRLTIRASQNVLDPRTWSAAKAPNPVFTSDPGRGVWGTGHGSFFKSPDGTQDWQVYHATDNPTFGCNSGYRTTRAQRFTWRRDGTPDFGRPVSLGTDLAAPSGDRTFEVQLESARVVAAAATHSRPVSDPNFVGEAGTSVVASRRDASVTYAIRLRAAGRYRILVRLSTGPDRRRIGLVVSSQRRLWRLRTVDAQRYTPGVAELNLGRVKLPRGRLRFRFVFSSAGPAALDEIRFER